MIPNEKEYLALRVPCDAKMAGAETTTAEPAAESNRRIKRAEGKRGKISGRDNTDAEGPKIAIFDYGAGNIFSLKSALERNGAASVSVIRSLQNLNRFNGLVLPGVGNFDPAIMSIRADRKRFVNAIDDGIPIMGICLGMEMLFDKSEEGSLDGLKIFDGKVMALPKTKVKVPHMGWNNLEINISRRSRLLEGVGNGVWVYFVHSYHAVPEDESIVMASSNYGVSIPAVIERDNLIGVQFHPEKSGTSGAIMIRNFLRMCKEQKITRAAE